MESLLCARERGHPTLWHECYHPHPTDEKLKAPRTKFKPRFVSLHASLSSPGLRGISYHLRLGGPVPREECQQMALGHAMCQVQEYLDCAQQCFPGLGKAQELSGLHSQACLGPSPVPC